MIASAIPTFLERGIEKTQARRDRKAQQLAAVRSGESGPGHGLSTEDAVIMLLQDIADYDLILTRLRRQNGE